MIVLMSAFASQEYWDEMATITGQVESQSGDTGQERFDSWLGGWRMFLDHPIIGVGAQNFGMWIQDYFPIEEKAYRMWGRVAHSLYFTLLPEMGIVGTIFFFGMIWGNYKDQRYLSTLETKKGALLAATNLTEEEKESISKGIRTLHFLSLAYGGAMVAYLVTGIFISVLWYGYFWMLTSFYVITSNVARNIEEQIKNNSKTLKPENSIYMAYGKFDQVS
ncbi:lipid A core - O-antigen ligase and related enzymes [Candidatus Scalindua japonica]|uniref:Lipid A core-O-antigen ligase and related enzymes n=2 Tax=Candidatus Scalindua japonica TaxID=1284222 RepID=A0A286U4K7_9BACT|nr:lipid A core - O-antigen ligase and related enzymes [Candidatus Scalindua japonica]